MKMGKVIVLGLLSSLLLLNSKQLFSAANLKYAVVSSQQTDNIPMSDGSTYSGLLTNTEYRYYSDRDSKMLFAMLNLGGSLALAAGALLVGFNKFDFELTIKGLKETTQKEIPVKETKAKPIAQKVLSSTEIEEVAKELSVVPSFSKYEESQEEREKVKTINNVYTEDEDFEYDVDSDHEYETEEFDTEELEQSNILEDIANHRGHMLFACRTQSGKTSTVLGAIEKINELTRTS